MNQCSISATTATRQGSQAKKLEEMKHAKNNEIAAKRDAALEAKLKAAENKATEARARKEKAAEKKVALAQARKVEAAQKRAAVLEAKRIATEETSISDCKKKKRQLPKGQPMLMQGRKHKLPRKKRKTNLFVFLIFLK